MTESARSAALTLSERHPEKQGLKLPVLLFLQLRMNFQSAIQKNKDWNHTRSRKASHSSSFQSAIQKNKDWNYMGFRRLPSDDPFRAPSRKTRIETPIPPLRRDIFKNFQIAIQKNQDWNSRSVEFSKDRKVFQSAIQKNKDWNHKALIAAGIAGGTLGLFQSAIQKNKDWNTGTTREPIHESLL